MFTNKGLKCYYSESGNSNYTLKDYIKDIEIFRDEKKKEHGDQWENLKIQKVCL